jgi:hypothetical protein
MNFSEILNKKMDEIERPPLLPVGHYTAKIVKPPVLSDKSSDKGSWDILEFTLMPVAAGEDVDTDDLAKFGAFGPASAQRLSFMFNKEDQLACDRTTFNLKNFLTEHCGITGDDKSSLKELLDQSVGAHCMMFIRWEPDRNNPEIQYARIARTAPVS